MAKRKLSPDATHDERGNTRTPQPGLKELLSTERMGRRRLIPSNSSLAPKRREEDKVLRPNSEVEESNGDLRGEDLQLSTSSLAPKRENTDRILPPRLKEGSVGNFVGKEKHPSNSKKTGETVPFIQKSNAISSPDPDHIEIPEYPSTSRQTTIMNILTVIAKSLSGLRLRQNQLLLRRVHPEFQAYASAISRSALLADKLLAFRTSGPSFNAIRDTLSHPVEAEVDEMFLIRWVIMRLYAFGHPDLIASLGTVKTAKDVLEARKAYKRSTGYGTNSLPVYGNVRFNPEHIPGQIVKVFDTVPKLFARICEERRVGSTTILFKRVVELIGEAGIPYYSPGSIFQWLLACDLAELHEIVTPPTARDLAKRVELSVKKKKGGSGTWGGLVKDIEEEDWPEVTEDALTEHLESVYHGVKRALGTQDILFRKQGFWYSDLEHCLCKVVRSERY